MDENAEDPRRFSRMAYIFLFGAMWGYAAFGHAISDVALSNGLLYLWVIMAFIGVIFMVIKNSMVSDRAQKLKMTLADLFIAIILLILLYFIANSLGLIKAGIILVVESLYLWMYSRLLDKNMV